MKITITGCGWLGRPLATQMAASGHEVAGSTTTESKLALLEADGIRPFLYIAGEHGASIVKWFEADVLIINIPPGRREADNQGYDDRIASLVSLAKEGGCGKVLFISSTSVYANINGEVRESEAVYSSGDRATRMLRAEQVVQAAYGENASVLRFGGLFGPSRNPSRFMKNTGHTEGAVPVNLIHLKDCIGIISQMISQQQWGRVYHACAPIHPTREEFYGVACKLAQLPVPDFAALGTPYKIIVPDMVIADLQYKFVYANPLDGLGDS